MAITTNRSLGTLHILLVIRSFLIWTFILSVLLLVVGFPLVALMVTVGALLAIALHSVLPISSVLLVAGGLLGANILAVMISAAVLTLKGVYPNKVSWLRWLYGQANPAHTSVYASCPLTCDMSPKEILKGVLTKDVL